MYLFPSGKPRQKSVTLCVLIILGYYIDVETTDEILNSWLTDAKRLKGWVFYVNRQILTFWSGVKPIIKGPVTNSNLSILQLNTRFQCVVFYTR